MMLRYCTLTSSILSHVTYCYVTLCKAHVLHIMLRYCTLTSSSRSCLAQTEGFEWVNKSIPVFSKTTVEHVNMLEEQKRLTINTGVGVKTTKLADVCSGLRRGVHFA